MRKESKADEITNANRQISRPGKQRGHDKHTAATIPAALGAMTTGKHKGGETEQALKRATKTREAKH